MIVYHGSAVTVRNPDVLHSFRNLDFGKGFYVTTVRDQAVKWARRKADIARLKTAVLNVYDMQQPIGELRWKTFGEDLDEWIDFVCACRDGETLYQQFDLITGKVANDKVYRVVDLYHSGIWDKERAIKEIRAYPDYDQTAFITQKAIDQLLTFKSAEKVER